MIRNAVGTVISRTIVTATTKRTIGRLATRISRIGSPKITMPATKATVASSNNGTTVNTILPGNVSLLQDLPTTVTPNRLACQRTRRGEGAGEQRSERA